jgi:hypothetical protein
MASIAEACERGELAAAFKSVSAYAPGAEQLDRSHWRAPHWHSYFSLGTIDLDLPYLDNSSRPILDGRTVRCPGRDIFIRKDSLAEFVRSLSHATVAPSRFPGDTALIEEGRRMLATGMTKRAVARTLAPRAQGDGTIESTETRLRKAL